MRGRAARRPIVVQRRGPGVLGTVARTAVVASTATATSRAMSGAMDRSSQQMQQQPMANAAALQSQAELEQLQMQMAAMQSMQAQNAAAMAPTNTSATPDLLGQLQQLTQLKDAGALTDDEFLAAKAKLLGS